MRNDWKNRKLRISLEFMRKFQKIKFYFLYSKFYFPIFDNFCNKKNLIAKLILIITIIYVNFKGYFYRILKEV